MKMNRATEIELIKLHLRQTDNEEEDYKIVPLGELFYVFGAYIDRENKDSWRILERFSSRLDAGEYVKNLEKVKEKEEEK